MKTFPCLLLALVLSLSPSFAQKGKGKDKGNNHRPNHPHTNEGRPRSITELEDAVLSLLAEKEKILQRKQSRDQAARDLQRDLAKSEENRQEAIRLEILAATRDTIMEGLESTLIDLEIERLKVAIDREMHYHHHDPQIVQRLQGHILQVIDDSDRIVREIKQQQEDLHRARRLVTRKEDRDKDRAKRDADSLVLAIRLNNNTVEKNSLEIQKTRIQIDRILRSDFRREFGGGPRR